MKDKKSLLSMPEVEEAVKNRMDKLYNPNPNIKLLKQQVYTEIVSLWEIDGHFLEVTQTSQGKYLIYKLSKEEVKEWDKYSHFSGGLSDESANVGEESRILSGEWGNHLETEK